MLYHKTLVCKILFYCFLDTCNSFLETIFQSPTEPPNVMSSTASTSSAPIVPIASSSVGTGDLCQTGQEIQNGGFVSQCNGKFYAVVACLLPSNGERVPLGGRANDGNFEYACVSDGSTTSLKSTACIMDGQRLEANYAMAVGDFYKGCYQSSDGAIRTTIEGCVGQNKELIGHEQKFKKGDNEYHTCLPRMKIPRMKCPDKPPIG